MKCLNIGSGEDYKRSNSKKDWVNLDINKKIKADIYYDLNKVPYPFKDNEFDYVFMNHVIEHLSPNLDFTDFISEINRILKPGGIFEMRCPHFSGWNAYGADHKRYFSLRNFYNLPQFKIIKVELGTTLKLDTDRKKPRPWFSEIFNFIIEKVANLNPLFCERFCCYWVGGFMEMRFIFKNIKFEKSKVSKSMNRVY